MDTLKEILDSIQKGEAITIRTVSKTKEEITTELLANLSGLDINVLTSGTIRKDEWPKIINIVGMLSKLEIYFFDKDESINDMSIDRVIEV